MNDLKELFYDWMGGNDVVFLTINGIRHPHYDKFMQTVSKIGDHHNFIYYFAAIALFAGCRLSWKAMTGQAGKQSAGIWMGVLLMLLIGYGTTAIVTDQIKNHQGYPRPYIALASTGEVHMLETPKPQDDFRSFPSGHVVFTTFMVMTLWPVMGPLLSWCGVWLIMLMMWARISVGMHFPADVIGAVLITVPLVASVRWIVYTSLRKVFGIRC